ncbi:hypothetical protein GCM10023149_03630 [Mucilaginibacter gynuensis]|uniref:MFS transporter n=1 Tax=Mucilaginibacter gynuensis TaxID=1302236 RepID=A0ABP8FRD9_9SPHI
MRQTQPLPQTPKNFIQSVTIIHLALALGQVLFIAVCLFLTQSTAINITDTSEIFLIIVPVMTTSLFFISSYLYNKQLAAGADGDLKKKALNYQTALIIRLALLEGPSLLSIVAYLLTGNFLYIIVSGVIILYFLYIRPSKANVLDAMELTYEQKLQFDKADEVMQ